MTNYVFVFHGSTAADTATEAAQSQWFQQLGDTIVDMGHRTSDKIKTVEQGQVRDFTSDPIQGYIVIQADSLNAAADIAKGAPSGIVDVYEEYSA